MCTLYCVIYIYTLCISVCIIYTHTNIYILDAGNTSLYIYIYTHMNHMGLYENRIQPTFNGFPCSNKLMYHLSIVILE